MLWRRKHLEKSNLYLIADPSVCPYPKLLDVTLKAVAGGVDIVQLRDKIGRAKEILEFVAALKKHLDKRALLFMNDRVDLALLADADGVHVGQDDLSPRQARSLIGPDRFIGQSCQTLEHLNDVEDVDYIGFGSVFKTDTKPERAPMEIKILEKAVERVSKPLFAIGGITKRNLEQVRSCGVRRIAVTRAILEADDPKKSAQNLKYELKYNIS